MGDFQIEKLKHLNQMKDKIMQDYQRKAKAVETQHAIARSSAVSKSRLEKIKARQETIGKISDDTKSYLVKEARRACLRELLVPHDLTLLVHDEPVVRRQLPAAKRAVHTKGLLPIVPRNVHLQSERLPSVQVCD